MNHKRWGNIQALKKYLTSRISRRGKGIVLAVVASLFIGSIFGVISLQMAEEDNGMKAETINKSIDVSNQQAEGTTPDNVDSLSFYVVQAGVFEKEKNAEEWLDLFQEADYPGVQWKSDDDIYLFVGIESTEEAAKKIATEMKDADFDVFVKEWEVQTGELNVEETDEQYIQTFLTAWQQSLKKQDGQALRDFVEEDMETSETLQSFKKELKTLLDTKEEDAQKILLDTIYIYDSIN